MVFHLPKWYTVYYIACMNLKYTIVIKHTKFNTQITRSWTSFYTQILHVEWIPTSYYFTLHFNMEDVHINMLEKNNTRLWSLVTKKFMFNIKCLPNIHSGCKWPFQCKHKFRGQRKEKSYHLHELKALVQKGDTQHFYIFLWRDRNCLPFDHFGVISFLHKGIQLW